MPCLRTKIFTRRTLACSACKIEGHCCRRRAAPSKPLPIRAFNTGRTIRSRRFKASSRSATLKGAISFPSVLLIQPRNTFDTIFNISVAPMVHIGNIKVSIMPGIQYTVRRDTLSPFNMNQNLFRQFLYLSTSSIANWLSFSGNVIREAGPFTEQTCTPATSPEPSISRGTALGQDGLSHRL